MLEAIDISWARSLVDAWPVTGLVALLVLGAAGLPFPEDLTLVLCGALIADGDASPAVALPVVLAALLGTDISLYWVGRRLGPAMFSLGLVRRIISPPRLDALLRGFRRRGVAIILIGRHVVGLRAQIFLAAGVSGMSFPRFIVADAAAAVVTMGIMVGLGWAGGSAMHGLIGDLRRVEEAAVLAGLVGAAGWWGVRLWKEARGAVARRQSGLK